MPVVVDIESHEDTDKEDWEDVPGLWVEYSEMTSWRGHWRRKMRTLMHQNFTTLSTAALSWDFTNLYVKKSGT